MRTPSLLRRKGVKEMLQRFVEQVTQIPQVKAVLLAQGDEGLEVKVIVNEPDLTIVDAVAELEGTFIDRYGELPFLSDVVFLQGRSLEHILSPQTRMLFKR